MENKMSEEASCIICYEEFATSLERGRVRTGCGHSYCAICFAQVMRVSNQCSMCRHEITPDVPRDVPRDVHVIPDYEAITGEPLIPDPPYLLISSMMAEMNAHRDYEEDTPPLSFDTLNQSIFTIFSNMMRQG